MKTAMTAKPLLLLASSGSILTAAAANPIDIRRDTVVPIRFENAIDLRHAREGDRFRVRVENDRELPLGSRLDGRIEDLRRARNGREGYVELEFDTLILPDGSRHRIAARPVRLDSRYVREERDGRIVLKRSKSSPERIVGGSLLGGLIIGALLDKPFEGAVTGAIAGIIVAESERKDSERDSLIERGDRYGALFVRAFRTEYRGRYGDPFEDRYRQPDDWRREDDRGDRWYLDGRTEARCEWSGRTLRYERDQGPYSVDGTWMVALLPTARQLGFEVASYDGDRRYRLDDERCELLLEHGSQSYRLNGRRMSLPGVVSRRNGVPHVPAELFREATGEEIRINGTIPRF